MTQSALKLIDLDYIYLPFLQKAMDVIAACEARGATYRATSGYRNSAQQVALWRQGRFTPGPIVTNAMPGQSAHNFGLAIDFARIVNGKAVWKDSDYDTLIEEAVAHGLHSGVKYRDRPHVSWPGYITGVDLKPLALCFKATPGSDLDKLKAVWQLLEHGPTAP